MGRRGDRVELILEDVEIIDVAAEGNAIGKVDGMVVFVPYCIPGDVVDVRVTKKKKNYCEGRVVAIKRASTKRVEPKCEHYGMCGGCKWQLLSYEDQLAYKRQQVIDNFERLGAFDMPEVMPIIPSDNQYFYRNKLEYSFSNKKWFERKEDLEAAVELDGLGFHLPGMFDKILDINKCWLQPDPSNEIRLETKRFALENGWSFWNARGLNGFMRNMIIRTSSTGDVMVIVVFSEMDMERIEMMMEFLKGRFPAISSLIYVINEKVNDSIADLSPILYYGKPCMIEDMEGLKFEVGALSFYQTNSHQAYKLYSITRDFAALNGDEIVYDLYTGAGTIANFVAKKAKKVVGVEYVESAIVDARRNSKLNNIDNTVFYAGDMVKVLTPEFVTKNGHPDVVITDPPRAGMHEKVVEQIMAMKPDRIVYVSCNPATQARDITLMNELYKVDKIQPVDMFPHTHHVENVVLMVRR